MTYKATYKDSNVITYTTNICVGDIVGITDIGQVFPEYIKACNAVWKNEHGAKLAKRWSNQEWRVMGFVAHEIKQYGILVGVQNRNFEQAIVSIKYIALIRKKIKDTHEEVNVKTLNSSFSPENII